VIVVDASVAAKWLLSEEHTEKALALATATISEGERIVAPPLLPIEVANILRQRMRTAGLTLDAALGLFERFQSIPLNVRSPDGLTPRALALADEYRLPAVYDAHYVALAGMLGCDLWTNDQRLLRAVSGKLSFVRWVGDYRPPT
jgi:predicted nucleic acid-binding protein